MAPKKLGKSKGKSGATIEEARKVKISDEVKKFVQEARKQKQAKRLCLDGSTIHLFESGKEGLKAEVHGVNPGGFPRASYPTEKKSKCSVEVLVANLFQVHGS